MTLFLAVGILVAMALWAVGVNAIKDALLKVTKALPGSATTIYSDAIDTGKVNTNLGRQPGDVEYLLTAPALLDADLGSGATMKYSIITDSVDPLDGSSTVLFADCIVQTGAGSGAAAATFRFRLPSDAARLVGFLATNSASGDASDKSGTLEALF